MMGGGEEQIILGVAREIFPPMDKSDKIILSFFDVKKDDLVERITITPDEIKKYDDYEVLMIAKIEEKSSNKEIKITLYTK